MKTPPQAARKVLVRRKWDCLAQFLPETGLEVFHMEKYATVTIEPNLESWIQSIKKELVVLTESNKAKINLEHQDWIVGLYLGLSFLCISSSSV